MPSIEDVHQEIDRAISDLDRAFAGVQIVTDELVNFRKKMAGLMAAGFNVEEIGRAVAMADHVTATVDALAAGLTAIVQKTGESLG